MKAGASLVPSTSYQREMIRKLLARANLSSTVVSLGNKRAFKRAGIDAQDGHLVDNVLQGVSRLTASEMIQQLQAELGEPHYGRHD